MIKKFKYHAKKVTKYNCHVNFIGTCLDLGFTPQGLRPKFPCTGLPPSFHCDVNDLANRTSFELTNIVLENYKKLITEHEVELYNLFLRISIHSDLNLQSMQKLQDISENSDKFILHKSKNLEKKLNKLCSQLNLDCPTHVRFSTEGSFPRKC